MNGEPQDRFFIDHGAIHDRKTGRHVGEDRIEECCAELNALALSTFDAEVALRAQLAEAVRERDFFDAERIKVVAEADALRDELAAAVRQRDEARETIKIVQDACREGLATAVEALESISEIGDDGSAETAVEALAAIRGTEGK